MSAKDKKSLENAWPAPIRLLVMVLYIAALAVALYGCMFIVIGGAPLYNLIDYFNNTFTYSLAAQETLNYGLMLLGSSLLFITAMLILLAVITKIQNTFFSDKKTK